VSSFAVYLFGRAFPLFLALLVPGLLVGQIKFLGFELLQGRSWLYLLVLTITSAVPYYAVGRRSLPSGPFISVFCLLLLSDLSARSWTFFATPFTTPNILSLCFLCFLGGGLALRLLDYNPRVLFFGTVALMSILFIKGIDGRLLFGDDHPSFFYRLSLLTEMFPKIPFYNPEWNAGVSARDFFATGALGPFLLMFPALKLGLLEHPENYSYVVGLLAVVLPMVSVYLAAKILDFDDRSAFIGALLSLSPSLQFFEWLFHYGTLGFITSIAFSPLVFALGIRFLYHGRRPSKALTFSLIAASTFCFFWTLSVIAFVPLAISVLLNFGSLFREGRIAKIIPVLLIFSLINGPWIYVFMTESNVTSFVSGGKLPGTEQVSAPKVIKIDLIKKKIRELSVKISPLILILALPAILSLSTAKESRIFGATILWLLLVSFVGDFIKPQLELSRANLFATMLLTLPVGRYISILLDNLRSRSFVARKLVSTLLIAGVLLSPLNAGANYFGKSNIILRFAPESVSKFSTLVNEKAGEGRVFFLGFVLHEFGQSHLGVQDGGHLAPLPVWTKKEMFASHFFHARWSAIDPIPEEFRKRGAPGIEEFLDLVGVSSVVAFRKEWIKYCDENSNYELVGREGSFLLYKRRTATSLKILEGDAEIISVGLDRLEIRPKSPRVVLKYRYYPRLQTRAEIRLFPVKVFEEEVSKGQSVPFEFIGIDTPPELIERGEVIQIGYWR